MGKRLLGFVRSEIVLCVSLFLALLSVFFVPPDGGYLSYIDFRTLAILFCLMTVMGGLQRLNVFRQIGEKLISGVSRLRMLVIILVLLCFFFSMLITNDVALLTFVPFTIVVLHMAGSSKVLIPAIVIETIAANLGSMMTPMGNPQNLYLYSLAEMSLPQFLLLMLPLGAISLAGILLLCLILTPGDHVSLQMREDYSRDAAAKRRLGLYLLLFLLSLLTVARALDYRLCFLLLLAAVLIFDRQTLRQVDYSLLLTFIFLFVFIGNMKRIPAVSSLLSGIVGGHELLTAVIASQAISNVPAAILLSGFTENIRGLILGTNIGGLGTLIASMASLISFRQYGHAAHADRRRYFLVFTALNLLMLAVLLIAEILMGNL